MKKHLPTVTNIEFGKIAKSLSLLLSFFIMLSITACGDSVLEGAADDDSYEARIESARIALDDREYEKAKNELKNMKSDYPNDEEVCEYLSHAYAGLTGVDTIELLRTMDDLDDADQEGSLDMIGLVLGDGEGRLTAAQLSEKLGYIESAITTIDDCIPSLTDNQAVLLGVVSIVDAILRIGEVVLVDQEALLITLTNDGIREFYDNPTANFGNIPNIDETIAFLDEDSKNIETAVSIVSDLVPDGSDIEDSFSEFRDDLDRNGDGTIERSDLEGYINDIVDGN